MATVVLSLWTHQLIIEINHHRQPFYLLKINLIRHQGREQPQVLGLYWLLEDKMLLIAWWVQRVVQLQQPSLTRINFIEVITYLKTDNNHSHHLFNRFNWISFNSKLDLITKYNSNNKLISHNKSHLICLMITISTLLLWVLQHLELLLIPDKPLVNSSPQIKI